MGWMKRRCWGFSLVEMMVAIAVASIIIQISISSYVKYVAKTEVNKAIQATASMQQVISDYYTDNGYFPGTSAVSSQTNPIPNVSLYTWYINGVDPCNASTSVCVAASIASLREIEIYFLSASSLSVAPSLLGSKVLVLYPVLNGNQVKFLCRSYAGSGSRSLDTTLLPAYCQN